MTKESTLTLGTILFHWAPDKWRDFYFRIADEAPVETVYIGETVCSKRAPFYESMYLEVTERLQKAGKKVIFSTLGEVTGRLDRRVVESTCALSDNLVEANDTSALWHLSGRAHTVGPLMNVYNEDTLTFLANNGACHFCLPSELPVKTLASLGKRAKELNTTLEIQVYGRIPLALSARCYHARAHGRTKDSCMFVCEQDPDGMELKTLSGSPFLAINGVQTLSFTCLNLMQELRELTQLGIESFRLSPHTTNMVRIAELFKDVLEERTNAKSAVIQLKEINETPFSNGFYHDTEGFRWIDAAESRI